MTDVHEFVQNCIRRIVTGRDKKIFRPSATNLHCLQPNEVIHMILLHLEEAERFEVDYGLLLE